jgi:cobalt-zinc-cadmium efflux system membrane fusion protein
MSMPRLVSSVAALAVAWGCQGAPEPAASEAAPEATAVVTLTPEVQAAIGLQTAVVARRALPLALEALGDVTARPEAEAVVHAPLDGVLAEVRANVGDRVRAGQALAVIRSAELGRAQATYLKALGEGRLAQRERQRQQRLFGDNLASRRELDEALQRDEAARVALTQAHEELRVHGLAEAAIATLGRRGRVEPLQPLRSPVTGTVTRRHALRGARVSPTDAEPLFALADLSVVRIETDIPERSLLAVKAGQQASIQVEALQGEPLTGRVVRVSPVLDTATHTGKAAIDVPNRAGRLRPGMSARVRLMTGEQATLAVPVAALQHEGERTFVFTALADGRFRETPVVVGPRAGDWLPVREGLAEGERVVTRGSFDLQSEAHKASFGGE